VACHVVSSNPLRKSLSLVCPPIPPPPLPQALAERLKEIEMVSEEVADAEPPAPAAIVKLDDQLLVEKLVASIEGKQVTHLGVVRTVIKEGDVALWAEVLAGLRTREAGPLLDALEEGQEEVELVAVVSYHFKLASELWRAELKRITDANATEVKRLKEEAEAAAAEAAAAAAEEDG
jgi:hypothetical protein